VIASVLRYDRAVEGPAQRGQTRDPGAVRGAVLRGEVEPGPVKATRSDRPEDRQSLVWIDRRKGHRIALADRLVRQRRSRMYVGDLRSGPRCGADQCRRADARETQGGDAKRSKTRSGREHRGLVRIQACGTLAHRAHAEWLGAMEHSAIIRARDATVGARCCKRTISPRAAARQRCSPESAFRWRRAARWWSVAPMAAARRRCCASLPASRTRRKE